MARQARWGARRSCSRRRGRSRARSWICGCPTRTCSSEVNGLVANLVAMHDILRDREHASVRLVMTPDRMVVAEAMRTFTYLSLYGYLTDGVVVNRVFPAELDGTYFGAWRERQQAELARVRDGFAPVPVLRGAVLRDRGRRGGDARPARRRAVRRRRRGRAAARRARAASSGSATATGTSGSRCRSRTAATCRSRRSATSWWWRSRGAGARSILPAALAALKPAGAALDDGALVVRFA